MSGHLETKLVRVYKLSARQAYYLVEAGYDRPSKIVAASDAQLLEVQGIGPAAVLLLRRQ